MKKRTLLTSGLAATAAGVSAIKANVAFAEGNIPSNQHNMYVKAKDGTELFVRRWGTGKPVLFLSGWALPSDFWMYQMLHLAQNGYMVVSYDRRGHGRSADPGRGYDHDTLADDLLSIVQSLGSEEVAVVSHSMGCTEISRYFARHAGQQISRVMFVGCITPFLTQSQSNTFGLPSIVFDDMRGAMSKDFPAWVDANTPPFFTSETTKDMMTWGKNLMMQTSLHAALSLAKANVETDFRSDVAKINVPCLMIHGDKDASAPIPLTATPTKDLIKGSTLVVYEGAPHGLPLTHAERLNQDMLDFVKEGR